MTTRRTSTQTKDAAQKKRRAASLRSQRTPAAAAQKATIKITEGFRLTDKQLLANNLLSKPQRHTMLVGGARSGKTFTLVRAIVVRALKAAGSRHVIFRLRSNALRASVWLDTLPKVIKLCFPELVGQYEEFQKDGYIKFPNGSEIWFGGLDDKERVEKILGMEFCTIYFNECSQIPYASVLVGLTRLAQKVEGLRNRVYYDLNPTGTAHWTYRLFVEGVDPNTRQPLRDKEQYACMYINPADNRDNVDPDYIALLEAMPERQRRRFLDGRYVNEVEGQLWSLEAIEATRCTFADVPKGLTRVTVNVDPSGCSGDEDKRSDEVGITVTARYDDPISGKSRGYLLADLSGRFAPEDWAKRVVQAFKDYMADAVVAEANFGGDMVRAVIQAAEPNVPVIVVKATRSKVVRAEPVSVLWEKGICGVVGSMPLLEEQFCNFTTAGYIGDRSPDRADSAIWGFTELFIGEQTTGLLEFLRDQSAALKAEQEKQKGMQNG